MNFRVELDLFRGPLDLLLYLVRKHELDVVDIRIAAVTEQYLEYIAVLEQIDVDAVGDFLDMASTLIEIKSRMRAARRGGSASTSSKIRGRSWSAGCWNTSNTATRPACSKSGAASGASAFRGWPTTCPRGSVAPTSSRSRKSSCGIW